DRDPARSRRRRAVGQFLSTAGGLRVRLTRVFMVCFAGAVHSAGISPPDSWAKFSIQLTPRWSRHVSLRLPMRATTAEQRQTVARGAVGKDGLIFRGCAVFPKLALARRSRCL